MFKDREKNTTRHNAWHLYQKHTAMARLRLSHNLHIVGPQYAFDSPLLERTTTSVEKPTRKNSWAQAASAIGA